MSPKAKRKRVHVQIRTDVPQEDAVVTRVEVTRGHSHQILTKSTKVSIPVAPTAASHHLFPQAPDPDTLLPTLDDDPAPSAKKARKGPSRSVATTLEEWMPHESEFADRMMRHEGIGAHPALPPCELCDAAGASYRCVDCSPSGFFCAACIVHDHFRHLLHEIEQWNGTFFAKTTLFDLGLSHQLGHSAGDLCALPSDPVSLTLFDITGVHTVRVLYCFCEDNHDGNRRTQLLDARWFPASWSRPGTAFTFRFLDFLHKLQTRSKINLYDFYNSLVSVTNAAGTSPPVYRYNELSLVLRIWVYLRQVRRGGGVHVLGGSGALAPGSLAVECPACPHPNKNLVSPHVDSWLNTLYLSMDANFKLKQKERGFNDPPLSNGLSFMVLNEKLRDHLARCSKKDLVSDINTCGSTFNAVSQAYTKHSKGYAVTGVGGVDCARHGFKRPNGVVDLQKGERYCNMDFALMSTLIPSLKAGISRVLVSYDIGCQWHKNLQVRLDSYTASHSTNLANLKYWKVVVPKFHIYGHGGECQVLFNLAYVKWAGRMDGERIEGGWAQTIGMATWTRESGPFARRNILDDHWNAHNWWKLLGLRTFLFKNLRVSLAWSKSQRAVANLASATYSTPVVEEWVRIRDEFDLEQSKPNPDQSKPNPYEEVVNHTTMAELKLELLKEEVRERVGHASPPKFSQGGLFRKAIEIEDRQYVLSTKEKAKPTTIRGHSEVIELRNTLSKDLLELREAQRIHTPGLVPLLEGDENLDEPIKLWLPSEMTLENRAAWCLPDIPPLEFRFRYAQANDSIIKICRLRRLLQSHIDQKAKHLSHAQRNVTRTDGIFNGVQGRIHRAVKRYRHARHAMMALDPSQQFSPGWIHRFRELADADVRGPGRETDDKSEGRFQPSWIWMVPRQPSGVTDSGLPPSESSIASSDDGTSDPVSTPEEDLEVANSMRVHWAKCQARAERYEEEVALTVEEMGRTLRYFEWKRSHWLSLQRPRKLSPTPPPIEVQQGLDAYAYRQAHIYETLIVSFVNLWRNILVPNNLGSDWLRQYPIATDPLSTRPSRGHSRPTVEPSLTPVASASIPPSAPSPVLPPTTDTTADTTTDPPIGSDTESDDDSDYVVDEGEESDIEF